LKVKIIMQKKFVLEIEYLFYSYVQVCLHVSTCQGVVRDVEGGGHAWP
jgi:hypothetical protein